MKRSVPQLIAGLLLAAAIHPAAAQDVVNVTVSTDPAGARYIVDGQTYTSSTTFLWQRGSKHVVTVVTPNFTNELGGTLCEPGGSASHRQYDATCRMRYNFGGWEANTGITLTPLLTQTITAEPGLTSLKARFTLEYKVDVVLVEGPTGGPSSNCVAKANNPVLFRRAGEGVGIAIVNDQCFDYTGSMWLTGGDITLQAIPLEGFAFAGWMLDGAPPRDSITTYKLRGPAVLAPRFVNAKRVQLVTEPVGLRVRVNRTEIQTPNLAEWVNAAPVPGRFDWIPGAPQTLGAVSPQTDQERTGKMWVFDAWSNGGGQDMTYIPDDRVSQMDILTAKFVPGVQVNFSTEPRGLRLNIDGRENWPVYGFVWGLGSKYKVTAPAEQVDSKGRRWTFKGWKHGGPAAQEIVVDQKAIDSGGVWYTAMFESVPQITIQSSLPGMKIRVDDSECSSPCRFDKPMGTQLRVAVPDRIAMSEVARWDFQGWNDGAGAERVLTVERETSAFQANYRRAYRLIAVLDPEDGGSIRAEPASADGFYADGQDVAVTAETNPGFKFRRWDGDLTGAIPSGLLNMNMPRAIRAALDKVPHLPEAAVRNAAGPTPVEGVAPGSLISIAGASLTEEFQAGPASPLVQTLGGVVVTIGDRILPLVYVSPDQINALLPSDLPVGTHRLLVRPQTGASVSTEFQVVRNAPGLFSTRVEDRGYAVALREDGSVVTPQNRARRNEVITLLGTGLGPFNRPVVDGFAVPATPQYSLLEPVDVTIGAATVRALSAIANPGQVGVTAVRVRIPADAAGEADLRVTVNGASSNSVLLSIE